jgi:hypothetical protein
MTRDLVRPSEPSASSKEHAKTTTWLVLAWPAALLLNGLAVLAVIVSGALPLLIADYLTLPWLVGPGLLWALATYAVAAWALARWPFDRQVERYLLARGTGRPGPTKRDGPDAKE